MTNNFRVIDPFIHFYIQYLQIIRETEKPYKLQTYQTCKKNSLQGPNKHNMHEINFLSSMKMNENQLECKILLNSL